MIAFLAAVPAAFVSAAGNVFEDPSLGPTAFVVLAVALLLLSYVAARALIDRSALLFLERLLLAGFLPRSPHVFAAHEILLGHP